MALLARALERETLGFISMTMMRPSEGSTANWMLHPPVSTPTSRMISMPMSRSFWYSRSVRVSAGATVIESPVCTPTGSTFSIEQTTTVLSALSRMISSSYSFQPRMDSSSSTSVVGLWCSPSPTMRISSASVCAKPLPRPPMVKEGRMTMRVAEVVGEAERLLDGVRDVGAGHFGSGLDRDVFELLPVLALLDRLEAGADQFDVVLLEHAVFEQLRGGVECRLAAEGRQDRIRPLQRDDGLDDFPGDRFDVGGVGEVGVGHDRGRVGVDQDDPDALFAQHAAGLGAGVVEFAGLTDDDRAGADDEDAVDVVAFGHQLPSAVLVVAGGLVGLVPFAVRAPCP